MALMSLVQILSRFSSTTDTDRGYKEYSPLTIALTPPANCLASISVVAIKKSSSSFSNFVGTEVLNALSLEAYPKNLGWLIIAERCFVPRS